MPASMNSNKGESSPGRFLFQTLVNNGRLQDSHSPDKSAVGGFGGRYDKSASKDYLPKGITRESEKLALTEKAISMVNIANQQANSKVLPKLQTLAQGSPTMAQVANAVKDLAKYESKTNYFGGDLRFSQGARILTPYEQNLIKGIKLEGSTGVLEKNILTALEKTGLTPKQIVTELVNNRVGYNPEPTP
jgi:hypothetical protein